LDQPQITDLFPEPTYEELETALQEWMNPENADSDTTSTQNSTTTNTSTTETVTKKTDVAEAFNDLFND
jgi:hypothetical protein